MILISKVDAEARASSISAEMALASGKLPGIEDLLALAVRNTGLVDFGTADFRIGLDQMLASLNNNPGFDEKSAASVLALMVKRLENRLEVEEWHRLNPSARNAKVGGPISITGLPRTGTTALVNLMSLDTQFRPLRPWEQATPCPPPETATEEQDPRRLAMIRALETLQREQPEQMAMHLYDADATEEDHEAIGISFAAQHSVLPLYEYHRWWRENDMREAYAYHRRLLQMLQSRRPPHLWLLKAPHHKFHLEAIVAAYPDVRFVFTHRDPAKVIPSYLSFATSLYPAGAVERIGLERVSREIYQHLLQGMRQALAARARLDEGRFVDVQQSELVRDPLGTLRRVYADLHLPFTPEFEAKAETWHAANKTGAHGSHVYSPEQFGLTASGIRSDFAFYSRHFGFDW